MKIKRLTSLAATSLMLLGCQSLTSREKTALYSFVGASAGATVGQYLYESRNDKDASRSGTVYSSAMVGAAIGMGSSFLIKDNEAELKAKIASLQDFERQRQISSESLPDWVVGGVELKSFGSKELNGNPPQCEKRNLLLCPEGDNPDQFSNCSKPSLLYVSPNWALEFRAWYSKSGCWASRNYAEIPGLKEYLNETFISSYLRLRRNQSEISH